MKFILDTSDKFYKDKWHNIKEKIKMQTMKILWIKEVKNPTTNEIAYDDITEGDSFYLHWPRNVPDTIITSIQLDQILLLKQNGVITHVVTPISFEVFSSGNDEYPRCREFYCIKRTETRVDALLGQPRNMSI